MEFKEVLKKLRNKEGLYQSELAEALGVTRTAITKWEAGTRSPDIMQLSAIADYFHVSTDYLLGRETYTEDIREQARADEERAQRRWRDSKKS